MEAMKENKKPHSADNITDIIESVVKGAEDDLKKQISVDIKSIVPEKVNVIPSSDGENSRDGDEKIGECEIVKLPENLPSDIVDVIDRIKEYAIKSNEAKTKFFSGPVRDLLLK